MTRNQMLALKPGDKVRVVSGLFIPPGVLTVKGHSRIHPWQDDYNPGVTFLREDGHRNWVGYKDHDRIHLL